MTDTRVQDIVIQSEANKIQVFLGRTTPPNFFEYDLPAGAATPTLGQPNYSSPAIAALDGCTFRDIVVGTDSGHVVALRFTGVGSRLTLLCSSPFGIPFEPSGAQWATFHGNNARTGSLSYEDLASPTRGSVAGIVTTCTLVKLRSNTNPFPIVNDGYGDLAVATSANELSATGGRYLFELIPPGAYRVRFNGDAATDKVITVTAGHMTRVDGDCRTCTP